MEIDIKDTECLCYLLSYWFRGLQRDSQCRQICWQWDQRRSWCLQHRLSRICCPCRPPLYIEIKLEYEPNGLISLNANLMTHQENIKISRRYLPKFTDAIFKVALIFLKKRIFVSAGLYQLLFFSTHLFFDLIYDIFLIYLYIAWYDYLTKFLHKILFFRL